MKFGISVAATALLFASAPLALCGGALAETGTRSIVKATWYGGKFCGRKTASGERYDCGAMTAAHPSLPFGTKILVRNLHNDREAVLRVNDRGPAAWTGNGLDVSPVGNKALGLNGKAKVSITVLSRPALNAYAYSPKQRHKKHRR